MNAKQRFNDILHIYNAGNYEAASTAVAAALRVSPKEANFLHLASLIAEAQQEFPRAEMFLNRALTQRPNWIEAEFNLARVLAKQAKYDEAVMRIKAVIQLQPNMPYAYEHLAKFYQLSKRLPEAIEPWRKALELQPTNPDWRTQYHLLLRSLCLWNESITNLDNFTPQATTVLCDDPEIQKNAATRYAANTYSRFTPLPPPAWTPHKRLRIGYLSSDFVAHATSYLMAELFELQDRNAFEIYVYSYSWDDKSEIRERIKKTADHFIDIAYLSPVTAAARIRDDEIDILVDLKGYTNNNRLEILAYRPARVQLHWLGYPGTLGTPFVQYFIADETTIPYDNEKFFTEKILRIPYTYQINDRKRTMAVPLSREAYGLPSHGLVLASFNQTYKITPEMFDVWCSLLKDLPDAVLWLFATNDFAPDNLRQEAQKRGIDPMRLVFAKDMPVEEHLARYNVVDVAIDTFPVGGHTTTSDALWAGTPVVTCMGKSFVSRVAASVLRAAELNELVTETMEDYRKKILLLANDKAKRETLKEHLKTKRDVLPLFNTPRFVRNWESVLLNITPRT